MEHRGSGRWARGSTSSGSQRLSDGSAPGTTTTWTHLEKRVQLIYGIYYIHFFKQTELNILLSLLIFGHLTILFDLSYSTRHTRFD